MRFLFPVLFVFFLSSCSRSNELIVYADPWLEEFATASVERFQTLHPDLEIEIRFYSSEHIAQQVRLGQPIDLFLALSPAVPQDDGWQEIQQTYFTLGSDKVAKVRCKKRTLQTQFQSENCWIKAADGRPLRILTDEWVAIEPAYDTCRIVANFPAQTKQYLLDGWAEGGYVFASFAENNPGSLELLESGPILQGVYQAVVLKNGPNMKLGEELALMMMDDKSKALLADIHINPYFYRP